MAPEKVVLVGTIHASLDGAKNLRKILDHYKPSAISIEDDVSPAYEDAAEHLFDNIDGDKVVKKAADLAMKPYESLSGEELEKTLLELADIADETVAASDYEHRVPEEYCNENSISLYRIDSCAAALRMLAAEIDEDDIAAILASYTKPRDVLKREEMERYDKKDLTILEDDELKNELLSDRDRYMAEQIMLIDTKLLVHICGGGHIFGNYHNLTNRLIDAGLDVETVKLHDAEGL